MDAQKSKKSMSVQTLTKIGLLTAVTCIVGPLSIPIGPVPISLTNFAIYLAVLLLGWKQGTVSYLVYLFLGLVGIPVFSGFSGGAGKLLGPTGGYLIGFILMAAVGGWFIERFPGKKILYITGLAAGTLIAYLTGTAWLAVSARLSFSAALAAGVLPFIAGDILKILLAVWIGPKIRERLPR